MFPAQSTEHAFFLNINQPPQSGGLTATNIRIIQPVVLELFFSRQSSLSRFISPVETDVHWSRHIDL